jgi:hypothetical protein
MLRISERLELNCCLADGAAIRHGNFSGSTRGYWRWRWTRTAAAIRPALEHNGAAPLYVGSANSNRRRGSRFAKLTNPPPFWDYQLKMPILR